MEWSIRDSGRYEGWGRFREEPMKPVVVSVGLARLDDTTRARCSKCGLPLETHQPDEDMPERLIATCPECKAWYLVDLEGGVMILLPDQSDFRDDA
jgi:hypothetical protein